MDYATDSDLTRLRAACLATAAQYPPPEGFLGRSPLRGHCGAVSLMLRGMFGGEILYGEIEGEPHYWNRLRDGREVDLTSCQFGGDGFHPLTEGRSVQAPELTDPVYLAFAWAVRKLL